jgi:hypothetical protein
VNRLYSNGATDRLWERITADVQAADRGSAPMNNETADAKAKPLEALEDQLCRRRMPASF